MSLNIEPITMSLTTTSTLNSNLLFNNNNNNTQTFIGRKTLWDKNPHFNITPTTVTNSNIIPNYKSQRPSRWDSAFSKTFTPPPVTSIPPDIDQDTFENMLRKHRLHYITRCIATNIYEEDNDPDLRSPSPEPIYDSKTGKRLNTRQVINKEKYLKEKNDIITELIQYDKHYKPPTDYKPPKKVKIIYIQNNDKYKFTKYIIGPKGENQKKLEKLSNCKITIRGKGSNWNNNSSFHKNYRDELEPLHVYIQADNESDLAKGEELILPLLDENSEEYKKMKMALTIQYNNASNSNEPACEYCGEKGHKYWACPANLGQFNKTELKCMYCGDKGHPSIDCPFKPPEPVDNRTEARKEVDNVLEEISNTTDKYSTMILDMERKKGDIRNSVLLTGKK